MHEGHRNRLRNRFLAEDLDGFDIHNILELLLFYSIPRRNTNEIAHVLLNHFGSLNRVLDASYDELVSQEGIGENSACMLRAVSVLYDKYMRDSPNPDDLIDSVQKIGAYLNPVFRGKKSWDIWLVCLDGKNKVIDSVQILSGKHENMSFGIKEMVRVCLRKEAAAAFIAHNHPIGCAIPSKSDLEHTKSVISALRLVNVQLHDHLIFSRDGDFVSLAQSIDFNSMFLAR